MINSSVTYIPEDGPSPYDINNQNSESQTVNLSIIPNGINADETYIDPSNMINNPNATSLDFQGNVASPLGIGTAAVQAKTGWSNQKETTINLNKGSTIGESYIVNSQLEQNGKQSDIYIVRREGKVFVAKVYKRGWQPASKVKDFFRHSNHPNIANVLDFGNMMGNYYEIYEYYHEKTLEEFENSNMNFIRKVFIPGMNEGLHELHSQGIIHCDIKPSNIFLADDAGRVVIGDFGSTAVMGSDGSATITLQGTPEYSAPVTSFYGNATITPAYDYCSFGLVLYKLVTGHSLLGNTNTQEIAKIWQRGIKLPLGMNSRIAELISGLIEVDVEKRWGYKEVKRWCENEFISQKNIVRKKKEEAIKPLIFGSINGDMVRVTTITKLVNLMRENWNQAKVVVHRIETEYFIKQFDQDAANYLKELKKLSDDDEIVFKLLYKLEMSERIYFRGHNYGTLSEYLDFLGKNNNDEDAVDFIALGLFVHYLILRKADTRMIEQLNRLIAQSGARVPDTASIMAICYAFISEKELNLGDKIVTSLSEFIDYLYIQDIKRIRELIVRKDVLAWLYTMGLGSNVTIMSKMED